MNADIPIEDVRRVLPLAVCHFAAGTGDCLLPEGGSSGYSIEDIPAILRAATVAWEVGPPGDPSPWAQETASLTRHEGVLLATRGITAAWAKWCGSFERDMKKEDLDPEAAAFWHDHAEAAERVLAWIDTLDRSEVPA